MSAGHTRGPWEWDAGLITPDGPGRYSDIYVAGEDNELTIIAEFNDSIPEGRANARLISLSTVIPDIYSSEINASIDWFWDGGFEVAIGDKINGIRKRGNCDTWVEALEWLQGAAIEAYPDSEFALARALIARATDQGEMK